MSIQVSLTGPPASARIRSRAPPTGPDPPRKTWSVARRRGGGGGRSQAPPHPAQQPRRDLLERHPRPDRSRREDGPAGAHGTLVGHLDRPVRLDPAEPLVERPAGGEAGVGHLGRGATERAFDLLVADDGAEDLELPPDLRPALDAPNR